MLRSPCCLVRSVLCAFREKRHYTLSCCPVRLLHGTTLVPTGRILVEFDVGIFFLSISSYPFLLILQSSDWLAAFHLELLQAILFIAV